MFIILCNNNYGLFGIQGHNINHVAGNKAQTLRHTHTQFNFCVFFVCLFLHVFTHNLKTAKIITPADNPTIWMQRLFCKSSFATSFSLLHWGCTKQVFLRGSSFGTASLKLLSERKIQAVKTPVEWMRWMQRLDYGNNSELFMKSRSSHTGRL